MSQNPTENLRRGRRRIEEIPEIILLKDWTWDVVTKRFYLHIRVCLDHDGKDIPRVTEWFVTAETVYPFGTMVLITHFWKIQQLSKQITMVSGSHSLIYGNG